MLGALGIAAAALWVMPSVADAFEGPKGVVWGGVAVALALAGVFSGGCGILPRRIGRGISMKCPSGGRSEGASLPDVGHFLPIGLLPWGLLAWMAARTVLAVWGGAWAAMADAARPLAAWATPLVVFALAARLPWSAAGRLGLARTVVLLGVAEACLMVLQRFGLDPLFGETTRTIAYGPGRMIGTVGYQNQAAEFLGVALCCVPVAWRNRWARGGVAAVLAGTMLLTANRGALLGLGVVAIAAVVRWGWGTRRRALLWGLPAGLLMAAGLALAVPETRARLAELTAPGRSEAVQSRGWMARVAVSLWRDNPVCGAGAGAYEREYVDRLGALLPEEKSHALLRSIVWAREAHCDLLQFGAEFGWIGLAMLAAFGAALWRTRRHTPEDASALAAVLFLSVCSLFSFSWQTTLAAPTVALWLGAVRGRESVEDRIRFAPGGLLGVAAAVLLLWAALMPTDVARTSPAELAEQADALLREGRAEESLAIWQRLVRSGLLYEVALHGESRALESLGRLSEAAQTEDWRFTKFAPQFTDAQLYRLCVLQMQTGDHGRAGYIARLFWRRCHILYDDAERWTPEWANLLGAALLAAGRPDDARPYFLDALARNPDLETARRNLSACPEPGRPPE